MPVSKKSSPPENASRHLPQEATARIRRLELVARRTVEGVMSGMHRSPYFGQSVEFLQHRQYTVGDDLRHIDWKVWGRQDRLHIKQYEEETTLRLHLLVDSSASMNYGEGEANKYHYAASLAACLAYLAVRQQDSIGLYTFAARVVQALPARMGRLQLSRLLAVLDGTTEDRETDLSKVVREVAPTIPRRGVVAIASDLLGTTNLLDALQMLRQRGHDVIMIHVLHRDELEFPFTGATRFEGLEGAEFLNCNPRALREGYLEAVQQFLEQTRRLCGRLSIEYFQAVTDQPLDATLAKFLTLRSGLPRLRS